MAMTAANYATDAAALAAGDPSAALNDLMSKFHSGQREAKIIVPVQNQMWASVVECYNEAQMASLARAVQLRDTVAQMWNNFANWVQSHPWSDGRAAQQALDVSKDPYKSVHGVLQNIDARIQYLSAGGTGATGSTPATAAAATPGGTGLIYVGGGLLVAKLLGFL